MPPDAIRECALALLRRAIMPLTGCGSVLVAEIDILLAEAKRTFAEKQQHPGTNPPLSRVGMDRDKGPDKITEHEGLGAPLMDGHALLWVAIQSLERIVATHEDHATDLLLLQQCNARIVAAEKRLADENMRLMLQLQDLERRFEESKHKEE